MFEEEEVVTIKISKEELNIRGMGDGYVHGSQLGAVDTPHRRPLGVSRDAVAERASGVRRRDTVSSAAAISSNMAQAGWPPGDAAPSRGLAPDPMLGTALRAGGPDDIAA